MALRCKKCGFLASGYPKCGNCGSDLLTNIEEETQRLEQQIKELVIKRETELCDMEIIYSFKNNEHCYICNDFADNTHHILMSNHDVSIRENFTMHLCFKCHKRVHGMYNTHHLSSYENFEQQQRNEIIDTVKEYYALKHIKRCFEFIDKMRPINKVKP